MLNQGRFIFTALAAGCAALILSCGSDPKPHKNDSAKKDSTATAARDSAADSLPPAMGVILSNENVLNELDSLPLSVTDSEGSPDDTVSFYVIGEPNAMSPFPLPLKHRVEKGMVLPKPFRPLDVMRFLYGGRTFVVKHFFDHSQIICFWSSGQATSEMNKNVKPDSDLYESFSEGVDTRFVDTLTYMGGDGKRRLLLCVNSSPTQNDFIRTGRFTRGHMGILQFIDDDAGWKLINAQQSIGTFGLFGAFLMPVLMKAGNDHFVLRINNYDQGFAGPVYEDESFVSLDGSDCKTLLNAVPSAFGNIGYSEWHSTFSFDETKNGENGYYDLIITATGKLDVKDFDSEGLDELHPKLKTMATNLKRFTFVLTRRFVYSVQKGYTEASSNLSSDIK